MAEIPIRPGAVEAGVAALDGQEREALTAHIAQRVREARAGKGWSQEQLATACGWTQAAVSLYEAGHRRTGIYELCVLAEKLDRPLAFFLDDLPGRAALAVREEPPTSRERKLQDALADALLWLERIPPPEEEIRALGRGLWDETLENARALVAAREEPARRVLRMLMAVPDIDTVAQALHKAVEEVGPDWGFGGGPGWDALSDNQKGLFRAALYKLMEDGILAAREDTERPDDVKVARETLAIIEALGRDALETPQEPER